MGVQDREWWKEHQKAIPRATYNPRQFRRLRDVPYTLADVSASPRRGLSTWKMVLIWAVIGLLVYGLAKKVLNRPPTPVQQERMWKERGTPTTPTTAQQRA